jgi:hypothetical protein
VGGKIAASVAAGAAAGAAAMRAASLGAAAFLRRAFRSAASLSHLARTCWAWTRECAVRSSGAERANYTISRHLIVWV